MKNLRPNICLCVIFYFLLLINASQARAFSFFKDTPTPVTEGKVLVLAIAPFETKKSDSGEGRKVQKEIADEFRLNTNIKVIELSRPVSLGPDQNLETSLLDAEQIIAQNGADLLIWGDQNDVPYGENWNIHFSVSGSVKSAVREEGFSMHGPGTLSGIAELDTPVIVRWIVEGWSGLIEKSKGMEISGELQEMDVKIYSLLGDAQQRRWRPGVLRDLKRSLSVPLCSYADLTHDISTLRRAVVLVREITDSYSKSEHLEGWAYDQATLAALLASLGEAEGSPQDLLDSVKISRNILSYVKRDYSPTEWLKIQINRGNALERLGERQSNDQLLKEAISVYEDALKEIYPVAERSALVDLQNGIATAYVSLGEKKGG